MESHVHRRVSQVFSFYTLLRCVDAPLSSQKRLVHQKKQKEKEKKELEALKRGHLPNMRVVQRNVVYVTGLGPKYAKEEVRVLHPSG